MRLDKHTTCDSARYFFHLMNEGVDSADKCTTRLKNTKITGKIGERKMHFSLETVMHMKDGKEYVLAEVDTHCNEGYNLEMAMDIPFVACAIDGEGSDLLRSVKRFLRSLRA